MFNQKGGQQVLSVKKVVSPFTYDSSLVTLYPTIENIPSYYSSSDQLNNDRDIQRKLIDYFHSKATDKWLYNDFDSLLDYFEITNNKIKLISSVHKKNKNNSRKNSKLIFQFIEISLLTKKLIKKILMEYVFSMNVNWYDLYYHSKANKDLLLHRLKKKLRKLIRKIKK